jgi:hypothetical protein
MAYRWQLGCHKRNEWKSKNKLNHSNHWYSTKEISQLLYNWKNRGVGFNRVKVASNGGDLLLSKLIRC